MSKAPCRECKERKIGCHATCNAFSEWKVQQCKILKAMYLETLSPTAGAVARHEKWIKEHK